MKVKEKMSFLIGCIIGDCGIYLRKVKDLWEWDFCHADGELIEFKAKIIEAITGKSINIGDKVSSTTGSVQKRFTCSSKNGYLRLVANWFPFKKITDKIRFMNHPIGLSMLIVDDGSINCAKKKHKDGSIYFLPPKIWLHTCMYSDEECNILIEHIEKLCGAKGNLKKEKHKYNLIKFSFYDSKLIWSYIKEYTPTTKKLNYKFRHCDKFN